MKMSVKSVDEEGILEDTALKVGKDGYSLKGVDDGEKVDESGKELNAAMFKKPWKQGTLLKGRLFEGMLALRGEECSL